MAFIQQFSNRFLDKTDQLQWRVKRVGGHTFTRTVPLSKNQDKSCDIFLKKQSEIRKSQQLAKEVFKTRLDGAT